MKKNCFLLCTLTSHLCLQPSSDHIPPFSSLVTAITNAKNQMVRRIKSVRMDQHVPEKIRKGSTEDLTESLQVMAKLQIKYNQIQAYNHQTKSLQRRTRRLTEETKRLTSQLAAFKLRNDKWEEELAKNCQQTTTSA